MHSPDPPPPAHDSPAVAPPPPPAAPETISEVTPFGTIKAPEEVMVLTRNLLGVLLPWEDSI